MIDKSFKKFAVAVKIDLINLENIKNYSYIRKKNYDLQLRRHRTNLEHNSTYRTALVVRHNNP